MHLFGWLISSEQSHQLIVASAEGRLQDTPELAELCNRQVGLHRISIEIEPGMLCHQADNGLVCCSTETERTHAYEAVSGTMEQVGPAVFEEFSIFISLWH